MSLQRPIVGETDARVLPGLVGWFRAETLREKFGDGQAATYVLDESGNGCNASSAAGGATVPPLFKSSGCNGYASLVFDGVNDELRSGMTFGAVIKGCFALVKRTSAGNWNTGSEGFIGGLTAGDAGINGVAGTSTVAGNVAGTVYVNGVQTTTVVTNAWNLCYVEHTTADTFTSGFILGRVNSSAFYFGGEIAEAGFFTGTPTAAQRNAFFDAMVEKYALTGVVGSPA